MKNKHFTFTIVLIVIALIAGFFSGSYYKGSQTSTQSSGTSSFARGTTTGAFARGARTGGSGFGGGTTGTIISKDSQSIIISIPSGGSQIVFVNPSTNIMKNVSGSIDDLSIGTTVIVSGTTNSDGSSLTANSISTRPAQVVSSTNSN